MQGGTKFTRELVESSLGGEVYAFSELVGHMAPLRELRPPIAGISPGTAGVGDCESLFSHLGNKKTVAEK